jgi:ABC-type nitrate/sulfonate/bicarbonate transport system substrate-binding protein
MRSTATHCPQDNLDRRASRLAGRVALALLILVAMQGAAAAKRITIAASPTAILVYMAQERGYFRDQGLDVEVRTSQTGPSSISAVIEGRADLSTNAETPFIIRSFERSDLRILATISASDTMRLIARGDRAIKMPQDLAGKRIGVTLGSVADYFLARYLTLNGVPAAAATIVDLGPESITENLVNGEIDAGLTWEPFVRNAELALQDNVVTLPQQYDQFFYVMLVCTQSWLDAYPTEARAILRAIIQAETYAAEHPVEAKELVRRLFNISSDEIDYVWSLHNLYVSLPQALMFALEQQAEWHVRRKLTGARTIPNYLDFVATDSLREIRASSIGIVK